MLNFLQGDRNRYIHSIKTALACLIGYFITRSTRVTVDQWLVITIIVVMCAQANVGSMIQKSYMRFFGTLLGTLVSALTIITIGTNAIAIGCAIVLSAIFFSYLATSQSNVSESGTLGAVTTAIILLAPHPTLIIVGRRFIEISAGILIAALVSQFVLPIHAKLTLRRKQTQTLQQLRTYYLATLLTDQSHNEENEKNYQILDESIINLLISQRKLSTEANRELFAKKEFVVANFSNLLKYEREILRSITFMHQIFQLSPQSKKIFSSMQLLNDFHDKICDTLGKMAEYIKTGDKKIEFPIPSISLIKNALAQNTSFIDTEIQTYAYAFLFCAETLIARLNDITLVASEFSH